MRCEDGDRKGLERLCGTITRPALACERVQCDAAGRVVLKLKAPWRDGKNWLLCWSEVGAKYVGIVQCLIVTFWLHGIDATM